MFEVAERFRDFITHQFGLRFDEDRLPYLAALAQRRAEARHVSVDRYLAELVANAAERSFLATELTIGETYFFRHYDQYVAFREVMLCDGERGVRPDRPPRILSAGCSTGEEPYSLAMLMASLGPAWSDTAIIGADLNPAAVRHAEQGRYGTWSLRETPPGHVARYFRQDGKEFTLDSAIRRAVRFTTANLACAGDAIWCEEPFDVIFCRNVIMYFTPEVQRAVVARLARLLAVGGYLVLGHAETLRGLSSEFELCHTHGVFYYRRNEVVADSVTMQPPLLIKARRSVGRFARTGGAAEKTAAMPYPSSRDNRVPAAARPVPPVAAVLSLLAHERFAPALALLDAGGDAPGADQDLLELRAVILAHQGDFEASAAACRALLAHNPHNAGAYYVLALCSEGAEDDRAAIRNHDLAAHVDPQFAMPVLRRALLLRRARRWEDSRADLVRAGELLSTEDASRILLYGGGFTREALLSLCAAELSALEAAA